MNPLEMPWLSRLAAIALLVALLAGVYGLTVAPLLAGHRETDEALTEASEMLARYRQIAARRDTLQGQLDALGARQAESGIYLRGQTDSLAGAELQELVKRTIESGGGRLRSVQVLPTKTTGGFQRVSVRVQMTATISEAARILYAFEAGEAFLFVDSLDISNRKGRRRRGGEPDQNPMLLIRLDLSGFLRSEVVG